MERKLNLHPTEWPRYADERVQARFWAKVEKTDHCWLWIPKSSKRYGSFWFNGKQYMAHRFAYVLNGGVIPEHYVLDHLCQETFCVNPSHLEPVTPEENSRRNNGYTRKRICGRGHPLEDENVYIRPGGHRPECKECRRIHTRRSYAKYRKKNEAQRKSEHQQRKMDAFWNKVQKDSSGCWFWLGRKLPTGWARFREGYAHHYAYKTFIGPVPEGSVLTPACENRGCVNPDHYQVVNRNVHRHKEFCKWGHPLFGDNLKIYKGEKRCRECLKLRKRKAWREGQRP